MTDDTDTNDGPTDDVRAQLRAMDAVWQALAPLTVNAKHHVLNWVRSQLGDDVHEDRTEAPEERTARRSPQSRQDCDLPITATGMTWLDRGEISAVDLEEIYACDGGAIEYVFGGDLPGKDRMQKTLHAHLLVGMAYLLFKGTTTFPDADVRDLCRDREAYEAANHAAYVKRMKRWFTGSKADGYTLTGPGKREATDLLRSMTQKG